MRIDWFQFDYDQNADDQAERNDHQERRVPIEFVCEIKANWNTQYLAARKRHLHKPHDPAANVDCKQIGDNSKADRTDYPSEDTREHAGGQ
ncbi:hypothetical protein D3C87_1722800 [compost metagenome]